MDFNSSAKFSLAGQSEVILPVFLLDKRKRSNVHDVRVVQGYLFLISSVFSSDFLVEIKTFLSSSSSDELGMEKSSTSTFRRCKPSLFSYERRQMRPMQLFY